MQALKICCWTLKIWVVQMALVLCIEAQNCSRPIAGPNMILSYNFINEETFLDGTQATFVCATGYVRAGGSKSITCTAGMWSEVKLICNKRSCGSPGEIQNGQYDLAEGIEFGAIVYAKCNKGYILVGSDKRTCMAEGWDNRVPVCEAVKCGDPPTILNGGPEDPPSDTYNYGDVVVYVCEKDFTMIGSSSISCSENEQFQPSPPECRKVSCPIPVVENGERVEGGPPPYKYKNFVTYRCKSGYEMAGQASLTCEVDGWSPAVPTCKAKNCSRPIGGPNMMLSLAFINEATFLDGAQVTFVCATGYVHAGGSKSITCTAEMWSKVEMICNKISCGSPGEIENGQYDLSEGIEFGAIVYAKCNKGYILVGSDKRTCMAEGWNNRVPVCEAVKCGDPPTILNGGPEVSTGDTYTYGDVVVYVCEKDFTMIGSSSISCSENEQFQPSPPECRKVSCPIPGVENGERVEGGPPPYKYKNFVTYRCKSGYEMAGQASLTCEVDGWSPAVPTCKETPPMPDPTDSSPCGWLCVFLIILAVACVFGAIIGIFVIKHYRRRRCSEGGYFGNVATKTSEDRAL